MSLRKQTIINSLGSLILLGCQWLISIFLVRIKGYEDAGVFALAMTIANVFSAIANYGLRNYQLTDAKRMARQGQYLLMRLVSSALVTVGCICYLVGFTNYTLPERRAIVLYLFYNLAIVISDSLHGSIQLKGHLETNGFSNIMRGVLCFVLFLGALLVSRNLIPALGAMALGSFLILLFYDFPRYRMFCKDMPETTAERISGSARLYIEGFSVMISTLIPFLVTAYPRTGILKLWGAEMLGFFSSVFTPASILSTIVPPALIAFLPEVSNRWREKSRRGLLKSILVQYGIVVGIILVSAAGAKLLGRALLELLLGASIRPYAGLLPLAVLAVGMNCICVCGNNIVVAVGGKDALLLFSGFALVMTCCFSKHFISTYGIAGAAGVQLAAYGAQAVLQLVFILIRIGRLKKCEKLSTK